MRAFFVVILLVPALAAAQPTRGDMQCKTAGKDLIFDCVLRLASGDQPLDGVQVMVSAEMPAMPGEHSAKPVKARPGDGPGEYRVRLDLDMPGEWDVKVRAAGKVLVLHYQFSERGARRRRCWPGSLRSSAPAMR